MVAKFQLTLDNSISFYFVSFPTLRDLYSWQSGSKVCHIAVLVWPPDWIVDERSAETSHLPLVMYFEPSSVYSSWCYKKSWCCMCNGDVLFRPYKGSYVVWCYYCFQHFLCLSRHILQKHPFISRDVVSASRQKEVKSVYQKAPNSLLQPCLLPSFSFSWRMLLWGFTNPGWEHHFLCSFPLLCSGN